MVETEKPEFEFDTIDIPAYLDFSLRHLHRSYYSANAHSFSLVFLVLCSYPSTTRASTKMKIWDGR